MYRMRLRWVTVLAATTMVVSSLAAQDAGGYGSSGGRGGWGGWGRDGAWGGHRMGGQGFDPSSMPSPEEIDGPPAPGTFRQLFSLTDPEADRYGHAWDSPMAETRLVRDSARVAQATIRSAFADHDRAAAQRQIKVLQRLGKALRKRDEVFDRSLAFLTKDQRKQYDDWKQDQKKAREERQEHRVRGDGGESRLGSS
jgi:Spy/CpxP family protein refolding chaperone